jgi:heme/copper-type cytochrome/quinol oxidase subunit 2
MTTSLKRSSLVISAFVFAIAVITAPVAFSASYGTAKPGSACPKVGLLKKSASTQLKCIKHGKKLIWQIVKPAKPITPNPSATPSASPTIASLPSQTAYDITASSSQWNFEFTYFVDGSRTARHSASGDSSILYIPENKNVHFTLTSADTTHGFWVPALSINSSMDPGVSGHLDFTTSKVGTFPGRCNVSSCGRGHAGMAFTVKVVSDQDFLKYLSSLK